MVIPISLVRCCDGEKSKKKKHIQLFVTKKLLSLQHNAIAFKRVEFIK